MYSNDSLAEICRFNHVALCKTCETFKFRNIRQRVEEPNFNYFTHRCEVAVGSCGFNVIEVERHVRDDI